MADRLVVGISGATGICYGVRVLELARKAGVETHLVVTPAGQQTRAHETSMPARDLAGLADVCYRPAEVGAAIASGSFRTGGRIVAPCSARTLSAIAFGYGGNLLARAADVTHSEHGEFHFPGLLSDQLAIYLDEKEAHSFRAGKVIHNCLLADRFPPGERPVKGSLENGWPDDVRRRVLANWNAYGFPARAGGM